MKKRMVQNPSLETIDEGEIVISDDGKLFVCVPCGYSCSGKSLNNGQTIIVDVADITIPYRIVDLSTEYDLVGDETMRLLCFILQRERERNQDLNFYSTFYRLACYVSLN